MPNTLRTAPYATTDEFVKGIWSRNFEETLKNTAVPSSLSRDGWGKAEWALFQQGRAGAHYDGGRRFYPDEELFCHRGNLRIFQNNMRHIKDFQEKLREKAIYLYMVIVPAKAHVDGYSPPCKETAYQGLRQELQGMGVPFLDGAKILASEHYLDRDTHWTPEGASLMAEEVAQELKPILWVKRFKRASFRNERSEVIDHRGDLARYYPGVRETMTAEKIQTYRPVMTDGQDIDLLGKYFPDVVLVGTSYSRNPLWNFEGFLKEELRVDIANMSQDGKGPIGAMAEYMNGRDFEKFLPRMIIWEFPERYFWMHAS